MIDELMENKQYGDLKRRAEDRKDGEFGYQGPAVWQNTEEEDQSKFYIELWFPIFCRQLFSIDYGHELFQ